MCLSLLMSKNLKLKKLIKSFVSEPKESCQVFRVFSDSYEYAYEHCERFPYRYEYVYFTCSYFWSWICYIRGRLVRLLIKKRGILFSTRNCIWLCASCVEYLSLRSLTVLLWSEVLVIIRDSSIGCLRVFANYMYMIELLDTIYKWGKKISKSKYTNIWI